MALPPRSFGIRHRPVRLETVDERHWRVVVDGRRLPATYLSERDAGEAGSAEVLRLDGVARAVLRHIRAGLNRKRS